MIGGRKRWGSKYYFCAIFICFNILLSSWCFSLSISNKDSGIIKSLKIPGMLLVCHCLFCWRSHFMQELVVRKPCCFKNHLNSNSFVVRWDTLDKLSWRAVQWTLWTGIISEILLGFKEKSERLTRLRKIKAAFEPPETAL